MDVPISEMIIAGVSGGLAVLLLGLFLPRKSCPRCNSVLPRFRKPSGGREAVLGGWPCPSCNTRIARNGRLRSNRGRTWRA